MPTVVMCVCDIHSRINRSQQFRITLESVLNLLVLTLTVQYQSAKGVPLASSHEPASALKPSSNQYMKNKS